MENGSTTPSDTLTPFTGESSHPLHHSHSQETLATSHSGMSSHSAIYPHPPPNTQANPSIQGEHEQEDPAVDTLADRLETVMRSEADSTGTEAELKTLAMSPTGISSPPSVDYPSPPPNTQANPSVKGDEDPEIHGVDGLAERLETIIPSDNDSTTETEGKLSTLPRCLNSSMDLSRAMFKSPPPNQKPRRPSRSEMLSKYCSPAGRSDATPTRLSYVTSAPRTFEHSTWALVAEEDVTLALKRMAQSARDEHQKDASKSVQQCYSERLARLIGNAEVEFDATYLQ